MCNPRASHCHPTELRVQPVTGSDGALSDALSKTIVDDSGEPLAIFRLLAHHEPLLRRFNGLGALLRGSEVTDPAHRELIVLRVAWRTDCTFAFDEHLPLALAAGVTPDSIAAAQGCAGQAIGPIDELLVTIVDEVIERDSVTDSTWRAASAIWMPAQLMELVMTVGFFRMASAFINSLGLRPRTSWAS